MEYSRRFKFLVCARNFEGDSDLEGARLSQIIQEIEQDGYQVLRARRDAMAFPSVGSQTRSADQSSAATRSCHGRLVRDAGMNTASPSCALSGLKASMPEVTPACAALSRQPGWTGRSPGS